MRIGQRAQFTNGARGEIVAVLNGGALYQFRADSGAKFTVRADEVAPVGETPKAPHVDTGTICRTVVRFESQYSEPRHGANGHGRAGRPRSADAVFDDAEVSQ